MGDTKIEDSIYYPKMDVIGRYYLIMSIELNLDFVKFIPYSVDELYLVKTTPTDLSVIDVFGKSREDVSIKSRDGKCNYSLSDLMYG